MVSITFNTANASRMERLSEDVCKKFNNFANLSCLGTVSLFCSVRQRIANNPIAAIMISYTCGDVMLGTGGADMRLPTTTMASLAGYNSGGKIPISSLLMLPMSCSR
eukprot:TRINITY_DN68624_c0_g1_i1.p2 TRINITY_DN68624_c0_g1~~TRINITY_DN68624_c0_g1_i1.p2  ORF type:complete len:107 (-),score=6.03 TRINITY_DN68624_c0_g1_i1:394-714(-)